MRISAKRLTTCLCVLLIFAVPMLVRLPTLEFPDMTEEERPSYQDEAGKYYLTDPDSYYYLRNVNHHTTTGRMGDSIAEDGTERDSLRFYPEGSKANNTPGIVYLTEAVWKPLNAVFGTSLYDVEYCLAAVMAAMAGLAAFLLVRRMSGNLGGLVGGILVSCAPAFVQRTTFGRFDTDMFVVLMDILMILFLTEALRAKTRGRTIGYSFGFVITVWIYSKCWTAEVVTVIAGFTLFGGFIYWIWNLIEMTKGEKKLGQAQSGQDRSELWIIVGCGVAVLVGLLILYGTGIVQSILSYIPLTADKITESGILPNSLILVSELTVADWFPKSFAQWFWDTAPGGNISVMTGVGGVMVMLLAMAGLVWLTARSLKRFRREEKQELSIQECRVYVCILLVTLLSWVFLIRYGMRFLEHLAVPIGILAGAAIGWIGQQIREKSGKIQWVRAGACAALVVATVVPAAAEAVGSITGTRPSVSRVSDEAMGWIRENAEDPEAVIASWWDNGYYYEAASGHPCLWDGGSMDSVRAILFSKALTAHNLELSRRILLMLSSSGNRAAEYLMEYTDAETAFDTIWEALLLDKAEAEKLLMSRCGMTAEEAKTAEILLHPKNPKETYLIVTDTMMMQIGWFEYYAYWDFNGDNLIPRATTLRYTPEGYPIDSMEGEEFMSKIRGGETLWRLYMDEEEDERFTVVFNRKDAVEGMWMWRVN